MYGETLVNLYPWSFFGPGVGWTSFKHGEIAVCRGGACWRWDDKNSKWIDTDNDSKGDSEFLGDLWSGGDIESAADYRIVPPDSLFPWSYGGPISAWSSKSQELIAFCNAALNISRIEYDTFCWLWDEKKDGFVDNDKPGESGYQRADFFNLKELWQDASAYIDESGRITYPWTGKGPTTGFNNSFNETAVLCNKNICWLWDDKNNTWKNNGKPVLLEDLFKNDSDIGSEFEGLDIKPQWALNNKDKFFYNNKKDRSADINMPAAWKKAQEISGDNQPLIAVIDTGVDYNHPDLENTSEQGQNRIFLGTGYGSPGMDDNGHGTHCAGIIASETDNNQGIAGICPNCRILPVKVLDFTGGGRVTDIINGIDWAVSEGADVLSMSLGGRYYSEAMQTRLDSAFEQGCVSIAAAGNMG